jgi:ribonuclease BN (tRNA processing enzyme)
LSEIVFVGTSDAFGAGGRRQSAVLVRAPGGSVLVDCGATTGSGLSAMGIDQDEIESIVVSHFHGDHFGGIPLLLLSALYEYRRTRPLRIAGPPGIEGRVRRLAAAMSHSLEDREWSFPLEFTELPAGREVPLGPVKVRSFETHHSPDSVPHGLILETGAERLAYSGDTGWFDQLPGLVAGAALFICECTYHADENQFEYHLNHELLVENKHRFDCGRILLTHLGAEMSDRRGHCEFETADDGLRIRT